MDSNGYLDRNRGSRLRPQRHVESSRYPHRTRVTGYHGYCPPGVVCSAGGMQGAIVPAPLICEALSAPCLRAALPAEVVTVPIEDFEKSGNSVVDVRRIRLVPGMQGPAGIGKCLQHLDHLNVPIHFISTTRMDPFAGVHISPFQTRIRVVPARQVAGLHFAVFAMLVLVHAAPVPHGP